MPRTYSIVLSALLAGPVAVTSAEEKKADQKGTVVSLDNLSSRTPGEWKEVETTGNIRYKQFTAPRVEGDARDAEVVIFYFGRGQGGGAKENIRRWQGMFQPPDGKTIEDATKVDNFKVGAVPVTYVELQGTYLYKARPFDTKSEPRPNHRMVSVIFDSPQGPYFIRVVGPEKTVTHHKKGFDEWIKNFK